jgi:hypothetical protein
LLVIEGEFGMKRMKLAIVITALLGIASVLVGCSSPPAASETNPVQAANGSKPMAVGASGAAGGSTPSSGAASAK